MKLCGGKYESHPAAVVQSNFGWAAAAYYSTRSAMPTPHTGRTRDNLTKQQVAWGARHHLGHLELLAGTETTMRREFTADELAQIRAAYERLEAVPRRAEAQANAYAAQLVADACYSPANAMRRARAAYGLERAPGLMPEPRLSRDWQRRVLGEQAESRTDGEPA